MAPSAAREQVLYSPARSAPGRRGAVLIDERPDAPAPPAPVRSPPGAGERHAMRRAMSARVPTPRSPASARSAAPPRRPDHRAAPAVGYAARLRACRVASTARGGRAEPAFEREPGRRRAGRAHHAPAVIAGRLARRPGPASGARAGGAAGGRRPRRWQRRGDAGGGAERRSVGNGADDARPDTRRVGHAQRVRGFGRQVPLGAVVGVRSAIDHRERSRRAPCS